MHRFKYLLMHILELRYINFKLYNPDVIQIIISEKLFKENFINKDMKSTMLKLRILRRISNSKINSYTLLKELGANKQFTKYLGGAGELKNEVYNTINGLEKFGYIKSTQKVENSRLKNYYTMTNKGNKTLRSAKRIFRIHVRKGLWRQSRRTRQRRASRQYP
jgi:DNA-binding PadR family transcriptional regulator